MPGGVTLDLRHDLAPVPAANRLSVPLEGVPRFLPAFTQAVLRHASELVAQDPTAEEWRLWLGRFFDNPWRQPGPAGIDWQSAAARDLDYVASHARYAVRRGRQRLFLSEDELRSAFGRWVPLNSDKQDCLISDPVNHGLLRYRPSRAGPDYVREYDLEAVPDPRPLLDERP